MLGDGVLVGLFDLLPPPNRARNRSAADCSFGKLDEELFPGNWMGFDEGPAPRFWYDPNL